MKNNNTDDLTTSLSQKKELSVLANFVNKLLTIKNPDEMLQQADKGGLKKSLGAFDLIILGVGAIIGSGIFTVVGIAAVGSNEQVLLL